MRRAVHSPPSRPTRFLRRTISALGGLLLAASMLIGLAGPAAAADTRTWTLAGVTFTDGATMTGTLTTDSTGTVVGANLATSAGALAAGTYQTPTAWISGSGSSFSVFLGNPITRVLALRVGGELSDVAVGASLPLLATSYECMNCAPVRYVATGSIVAGAVPPLALSGKPTVAGDPAVGQTLTGDDSSVASNPAAATRTYRWLRAGAPISGATSLAYVLTNADAGKQISFQVGLVPTWPEQTVPVAVSGVVGPVTGGELTLPQPVVSGTAVVGGSLSASLPSGLDPAEATVAWQWFRGATEIGAGSAAYTVTAADLGHVLTVTATASLPYFPTVSASRDTAPVVAAQFDALPAAAIEGVVKVGEVLTARIGPVTPTPDTLGYEWYADGSVVADATGSTFLLAPAHLGAVITVRVTAVRAGYDSSSVSQDTAPVVAAQFDALPAAAIEGVVKVGEVLTARIGTVTPTPDTLGYEWYADGGVVADATGSTFLLAPAHQGAVITVRVTAVRAGYDSSSVLSGGSGAVATHLAPTLDLRIGTTTLRRGEAAQLSWSSVDATTLTASGGWSGARADSGTVTVSPTTAGATTYVLSASNDNGTTIAQVTLDVLREVETFQVITGDRVHLAGGRLVVRASGLAAGEAYRVVVGGRTVATGAANNSGQVHRTVRIPAGTAGGKVLVDVLGSDGARHGSITIRVVRNKTLGMEVGKRYVRASTTQFVTVTGLAAGERVTVRYQGRRVSPRGATAWADGTFRAAFRAGAKRGTTRVHATGESGRKVARTFRVLGGYRGGPGSA